MVSFSENAHVHAVCVSGSSSADYSIGVGVVVSHTVDESGCTVDRNVGIRQYRSAPELLGCDAWKSQSWKSSTDPASKGTSTTLLMSTPVSSLILLSNPSGASNDSCSTASRCESGTILRHPFASVASSSAIQAEILCDPPK